MAEKDCCNSGFEHVGETRGVETMICQEIPAYLISPSDVSSSEHVLLVLSDVFGWRFQNTRIVCDRLMETTGLRVIMPDLHDGSSMEFERLKIIEERAGPGILAKMSHAAKIVGVLPSMTWFLSHGEKQTIPRLNRLMDRLAAEGVRSVSILGFCWGGKYSILLGANESFRKQLGIELGGIQVKCQIAAHPSFTSVPRDIEALSVPSLFVCAEEDMIFPLATAKKTEAILVNKGDARNKVLFTHGTKHGFANRGDIGDEIVKKAYEESLAAMAEFVRGCK